MKNKHNILKFDTSCDTLCNISCPFTELFRVTIQRLRNSTAIHYFNCKRIKIFWNYLIKFCKKNIMQLKFFHWQKLKLKIIAQINIWSSKFLRRLFILMWSVIKTSNSSCSTFFPTIFTLAFHQFNKEA